MGCQGFIGRIPSTFPDKFLRCINEDKLKNELQMYIKCSSLELMILINPERPF